MGEAELQNIIGMLTRAVATFGSACDRSVARLQKIECQLEQASGSEDVPLLKRSIQECLESIRDETLKQKAERARTHEMLQVLETSHSAPAKAPDPVTGLPNRLEAEAALAAAAEGQTPAYVAMLLVDRVALINSRYGHAAGDEVLKLFLESLQTRVLPDDRIFRWSGPAFVVILERTDRLEKVRHLFRAVVPGKIERTIHAANRTALISISSTWTLLPVVVPPADVIEELDKFLANQWKQGK
jgi:diguanylate cyclase (GGDEF)-like protein